MSYSSDRRQPKSGMAQPAAQRRGSASFTDQRASAAVHLQLKQKIDESTVAGASRSIKQLMTEEELEGTAPAQLMEDEDETLQGKFEPVQRAEFDDDEEPLQGKFAGSPTTQLAESPEARPNNTGLPDNLKSGIENLSGMSMDHVKVHYNSSQPAQLNAHAYAQGSHIHVAPGQERHLPHEAWHVVQQAQGRVQPTMQMKAGIAVNDDKGLEAEADAMGANALGVGQMLRRAQPATLDMVPSDASATNGLRTGNEPAQLLRFSTNQDFSNAAVIAPADLPPELKTIVATQYRHPGGPIETQVSTAENSVARGWLAEQLTPEPVGEHTWADIAEDDWAGLLGHPAVPAIEISSMEQSFFDQQNELMGELNESLSAEIADNEGRPFRIASLLIGAPVDGQLSSTFTHKVVEDAAAEFIEPAIVDDNGVRERIQANVYATLLASQQGQWIIANWESIGPTHDIFVDVDYYPNRTPDFGGGLHKDSVGETLFVNLTYNNTEAGASPEYVVDNDYEAQFEDRMPAAAGALIASARHGNRDDDGSIRGVSLPQRGRVSFIDPAVWHATPLYGHRPRLECADDLVVADRDQAEQLIRASPPFEDTIKNQAIADLPNNGFPRNGIWLKNHMLTHVRDDEPLRFGGRTNSPDVALPIIDTAPNGRRPRARSVHLAAYPESLAQLQDQRELARSFIRTWVILRPKA